MSPCCATCRPSRCCALAHVSYLCLFCAAGSVQPLVCGNSSVYCPVGSTWPIAVSAGYFTGGGANATVFSNETVCPIGYYCSGGVEISCPNGTFRSSMGGAAVTDCTTCPPGFFCSECLDRLYELARETVIESLCAYRVFLRHSRRVGSLAVM